jgi:hypothetical protein
MRIRTRKRDHPLKRAIWDHQKYLSDFPVNRDLDSQRPGQPDSQGSEASFPNNLVSRLEDRV